jgi:CDP-diacylglycerol--glycerol-3-phosphate 3-phosphatidyltransferase
LHGPYFTISNLLSISRLFFVWPIAHLLQQNNPAMNVTILVLIFLACLTDFLDGYLARKMNQISDFGKLLDPFADKVAIVITTLLLVHYRNFPLWLFGIMFARDLMIVLGAIFILGQRKFIVQSNWPGKITVGILAGVVIVHILVIKPLIPIFIGLSLAGIIISSISYVKRFIKIYKAEAKTAPLHVQKMS